MINKVNEIYRDEPNFRINSLQILHKYHEFIKIGEFENDYIDTYRSVASPLVSCSKSEKGIVMSTLPYVMVKIIEENHPILGTTTIYLVRLHR